MKTIKWLFGLCLMVLVVCGSGVQAADAGSDLETDVNDLSWNKRSDGTLEITGYQGTDETVVIPSEINGRAVTMIDSLAFFGCDTLKHVIIQEGVVYIGRQSFQSCGNLISVSLPDTVRTIGAYAFLDCAKLETINLPEELTSLGENAFEGCRNLKAISLPNGIKSIESYTFLGCSSLSDINLSDGLTKIGRGAFYDCSQLKSIILPDGLMDIGAEAFYGCSTLEKVNLPEGLTLLRGRIFENCENLVDVTLAEGLTYIGNYAFSGCSKLERIILPEGLISIDDYAFYECSSLMIVEIPDSVTSIGKCAFQRCSSMTKLIIPDSITNIAYSVFSGCSSLPNVEIPNSVTSIGDCAFLGCKSLEKLIIPDSVTQIGKDAFLLNDDDSIPIYGNPDAYVKTYCDNCKIHFSCLNHSNIVDVPAVAPNCRQYGKTAGTRCTVCGSYVIKPQEIEPNGQHLWEVRKFRNATVRRIGEKISVCTVCKIRNVEKIPKLALPQKGETVTGSTSDDNYKVTKPSVKNGMVELSKADKTKSNVTVPDTITVDGVTYKVISISKDAFKGNKKLKKVTIGKNVTKINANAFNGCKNLKTVTVKSTQIKTVGRNAFKGINAKAKIKVPKSKLKYYKELFAKKGLKSTVKIVK